MIAVGPYTLRADQTQAIADLRQEIARLKSQGLPARVILQGVCGFGKTVVSSALMSLMLKRGKRCAFLAHGRQLIFQKSRKLSECEIRHAVLMANCRDSLASHAVEQVGPIINHPIVVASKDTYQARAYDSESIEKLSVDVVIVDEAHGAMSADWLKILNDHPEVIVIGLTATPALANGKGLGGFYNGIVKAEGYSALIPAGYLVPCRVFAPYAVDMAGVKTVKGEFSQPQAAERFHKEELIGDVVTNWLKYGEDRPTAVFAQSVAHSIDLCSEFNANSIPAAHIDADSDQAERESVFARLESGELKVVCNYGVLRVGVDLPVLGCGVLACSMKSLPIYVQTVGRFCRACSNPYWFNGAKPDSILIDHGGNVYRHGWPTEDREWSLDSEGTVQEREQAKREKEGDPGAFSCFECGAMFDPRKHGTTCPHCGASRAKRGQKVLTTDGHLKEITEESVKTNKKSAEEKAWSRALGRAANSGLNIKQARILYQKQTGSWPPDYIEPMPPKEDWGLKAAQLYPGFVRRFKSAV